MREVLRTRLMHADSGEFIEFDTPIYMAKKDAQAHGSAITYARRYAILSLLGLVGDEDDDGEAATRPAPSAPRVAAKPTPITPAVEPVASRKAPEDDVPFAPDMPDASAEQETMFAPPGDGLTDKQSKMIGTLATKGNKEGWVTVEALREFTDGRFGKTSRKALTKSEASEVIEWLQKLERGDS